MEPQPQHQHRHGGNVVCPIHPLPCAPDSPRSIFTPRIHVANSDPLGSPAVVAGDWRAHHDQPSTPRHDPPTDGACCSSPGLTGRRLSAPITVSPSRRRSNIEEPYVFSVAQAAATLHARAADANHDEAAATSTATESEHRQHQLPPRLVYVGRPLSPERFLSAPDDDVLTVVDDAGSGALLQLTNSASGCVAAAHARWSARSFSLPVYDTELSVTSSSSGTPGVSVTQSTGAQDTATSEGSTAAGASSTASARVDLLRLPALSAVTAADEEDSDAPRRRHSVAASLLASRQLEVIAEEGAGSNPGLLQAKGSVRRHSIQDRTTTRAADLL